MWCTRPLCRPEEGWANLRYRVIATGRGLELVLVPWLAYPSLRASLSADERCEPCDVMPYSSVYDPGV